MTGPGSRIRAESAPRPPASLFTPTPRENLHRDAGRDAGRVPLRPVAGVPAPAPNPGNPNTGGPTTGGPTTSGPNTSGPNTSGPNTSGPAGTGPPGTWPNRRLAVAVAAVLLSAMLGLMTVAALGERDRTAAAQRASAPPGAVQPLPPSPRAAVPPAGPDRQFGGDAGTLGIEVTTVDEGTAVGLPGAGSRDWVAPGAGDPLVRADLPEESIEFRAADTQPGRPGPFRLSWRGGPPPDDRGTSTDILGVRPGGRVEFVVRPLAAPADLVLHLSGTDVAVTVDTGDDSLSRVLSAPAAVVTVALPADTAATVTIAAAGTEEVGVATAELG